MKKLTLVASALFAALAASSAFAQPTQPTPGEDKAVASKPATAAEKAAAKGVRKSEGKAATQASTAAPTDDKAAPAAKATKDEKVAAKAKRKAEGKAANKVDQKKDNPN